MLLNYEVNKIFCECDVSFKQKIVVTRMDRRKMYKRAILTVKFFPKIRDFVSHKHYTL